MERVFSSSHCIYACDACECAATVTAAAAAVRFCIHINPQCLCVACASFMPQCSDFACDACACVGWGGAALFYHRFLVFVCWKGRANFQSVCGRVHSSSGRMLLYPNYIVVQHVMYFIYMCCRMHVMFVATGATTACFSRSACLAARVTNR